MSATAPRGAMLGTRQARGPRGDPRLRAAAGRLQRRDLAHGERSMRPGRVQALERRRPERGPVQRPDRDARALVEEPLDDVVRAGPDRRRVEVPALGRAARRQRRVVRDERRRLAARRDGVEGHAAARRVALPPPLRGIPRERLRRRHRRDLLGRQREAAARPVDADDVPEARAGLDRVCASQSWCASLRGISASRPRRRRVLEYPRGERTSSSLCPARRAAATARRRSLKGADPWFRRLTARRVSGPRTARRPRRSSPSPPCAARRRAAAPARAAARRTPRRPRSPGRRDARRRPPPRRRRSSCPCRPPSRAHVLRGARRGAAASRPGARRLRPSLGRATT